MLCLPKSQSEKLKEALKNKDFSIANLYSMTSDERSALLGSYVGKEFGGLVNGEFEKAMISDQKNSLAKWVESTFNPKDKVLKDTTLDKINKMETLLNPKDGEDFLKDLVAAKLKLTLTPEEGKGIFDRAKILQDLAPKDDGTNLDKWGNPTLKYWEARADMEKYIQSLNPSSKLQVWMQNIGRNMLLASLHTPIKAIEGNLVNSAFEASARRISGWQFTSAVDIGLRKDYIKDATDLYSKTGYNISTIMSLKDDSLFGEKKISAQGKGAFNKAAQMVTDIVINKLHGLPFTAIESANFADSASLEATRIGKNEGLNGDELKTRATELFKDAASLNPKTEQGQAIRDKAKADAMQAVYVNKSSGSKITAYTKSIFNQLLPGLGDLTIPIAKIPANVISRGVEIAGGGFITSAVDFAEGWQEYQKTGDPKAWDAPKKNFIKTMIVMGLGTTAAYIIASRFNKDQFIGAYPTNANEVDLLKMRGGIANSVKIGNNWVSLEEFGPLAPTISGIMYAKKYGDGSVSSYIQNYIQGVIEGTEGLPGISQVMTALSWIKTAGTGGGFDMAKAGAGALTFVESRTIPAIVMDAFKVFKPESTATNNFGVTTKNPPAWQQFLFGSAVSQSYQGPILDELARLSDTKNSTTGAINLPALTDITKSPQMTILQGVLPPAKYIEAVNQFKINYRINVGNLMNNKYLAPATATKIAKVMDYASMTDEQKVAAINTIKTNTLDAIGKVYNVDLKSTTGKAVFEGNMSKAGDPSLTNLLADNPALYKGQTNPKGEKFYDRMPLADSNALRTKLYNSDPYWVNNGYTLADVQLDDILPHEAGGNGTVNNMMLISKFSDQANQPFELYMIEKYKTGTITRAQVAKASIDYKINKSVTLTDVKNGKY